MKKQFSVGISVLMCLSSSYAMLQKHDDDVCTWSPANVDCGKGTIPSLDAKGNVTLNQTVVQGVTHIVGMLHANQASLNTLTATGASTLNTSSVSGISTIVGAMNAHGSRLGEVIVTSDLTRFDNTVTEDINVLENGHRETICLNNSKINGSITFESGDGVVVLAGDSTITGSVKGGAIIKEDGC